MYLITGGFGQIGLYLTRRLLEQDKRVVLFDNRLDFHQLELICGPDAASRLTAVIGDLSSPTEILSAVVEHRPEAIIHLASVLPPFAERNSHYTIQQNVGGMLNVLEAARLFKVRRVLFASVPSVFGPPEYHGDHDVVVGDDAPHYPMTLYGISKSANERLAAYYWREHGVECMGFRICQGYGPGKRRGKAFGYEMFENAILGKPIMVPCGDDIINWQYVEDIADIFHRAIDARHTGQVVYNTTGEIHTMRDSMDELRRQVPGAEITLEPGVAGLVWRYDTARLEKDLGVGKPTPMKDGFAVTLATMRDWQRRGGWQ
jgi:UDP-glucose 4-epimerase